MELSEDKRSAMKFILDDSDFHKRFFPLSLTRSVADFRIGITTIKEKWEYFLKTEIAFCTEDYLATKYNFRNKTDCKNSEYINIKANIIPNNEIVTSILKGFPIESQKNILQINQISDIFTLNAECIENDFKIITSGRESAKLSATNMLIGMNSIFIEAGCEIEGCTFNTKEGVIYIGKNCKIMEGTHIRGPVAICDNSEIKLGTKIYGGTTIGPHCKIGGEINNAVIFGYTNKAHDGFLGNSVVGEWCNFGAGTNSSNLKNNYSTVNVFNYESMDYKNTDLIFCGLIMGDHSKCAIGTRFNTGTSVGVCANIFEADFPPKFIPSFAWGKEKYDFEKALDMIRKVMKRRNIILSENDKEILKYIHKQIWN